MVGLIIFTKLVDALVSSYTDLGSKLPKNDATITRKKTTQLLRPEFMSALSMFSVSHFMWHKSFLLVDESYVDFVYNCMFLRSLTVC